MNEGCELLKKAGSINNCCISDCSLSGEHIENIRANNVELIKVTLIKTTFARLRWRSSSLKQIDMNNLIASDVIFRLCNFTHVSARSAQFYRAKLENCSACGCDFEAATFEKTSLINSDFSRASFMGAYMPEVDAGYCTLRGTDFRSAVLVGADFRDADLRGADFSGAKLDNANFQGADLRGTIFDSDAPFSKDSEATPVFSPQMQTLASSVGPIVANLLHKGREYDMFSAEEQKTLLNELEDLVGKRDGRSHDLSDELISAMLQRAEGVGITSLLEALNSKQEEPPEVVAKLIKGLAEDLNLKQDATAEDLLRHLTKTNM